MVIKFPRSKKEEYAATYDDTRRAQLRRRVVLGYVGLILIILLMGLWVWSAHSGEKRYQRYIDTRADSAVDGLITAMVGADRALDGALAAGP